MFRIRLRVLGLGYIEVTGLVGFAGFVASALTHLLSRLRDHAHALVYPRPDWCSQGMGEFQFLK